MTYPLRNSRVHLNAVWEVSVFKPADLISPLGTDEIKHLTAADLKLIDQLFFKTLVWSRHLHASVITGLATTFIHKHFRSKENI